MSLKYLKYGFVLLINLLLMGCSSGNKDTASNKLYSYYIISHKHLGIEKGDSVFTLNYAVGVITEITATKKEIVYQLQLNQEEVLFWDSELLVFNNTLHVDNKKSTEQALKLGDTLFYPSAIQQSNETQEKTAITQDDIDALQLKIEKLSQLIDEVNGNP